MHQSGFVRANLGKSYLDMDKLAKALLQLLNNKNGNYKYNN